jgi:hypothetical protein
VPGGLLRRVGRPGVLLPVEVGPGFPWGCLVLLFVPSRPLSRLLGGGTSRAGCGIPAGQRPVALVGVTGFEPCGFFVPNGGPQVAAVPLSTGGGILSTIAVRLVRLVRSGGLGFVPFLFPGFMSASEATDVGRMTDVSGNHLRVGLAAATSGGNALTCDVLI